MSTSTVLATEASVTKALTQRSSEDESGVPEMSPCPASPTSWSDRMCRKVLESQLQHLNHGHLSVIDGCGLRSFGKPDNAGLVSEVTVLSPKFYRSMLTGGALGAAEAFMRGEWSSDNLTDLFRILLRNRDVLSRFKSWLSPLLSGMNRIGHLLRDNSRIGSRKNISQHYDLGNEFFRLFLDPTMMYSSAWFPSPEASLEEGSIEKIDRICRKLHLRSTDQVVEIGTGWGGFAMHAASQYGCHVTTTTISEEQYRCAQQRIADAGLEHRITVLKEDYRDLRGSYDKLVSIEMIEAVGDRHLPEYFSVCDRLLKPNGAMAIQAITMPEQRFAEYRRSVDFIQKYIFPGGFLPSVERMQQVVGAKTNLRMLDCTDFGHHYARTLQIWNERFHNQLDEVRSQGFDERFIRMWKYYMHYCEAAFLERATGVVQLVWAKPDCELGQIPATS